MALDFIIQVLDVDALLVSEFHTSFGKIAELGGVDFSGFLHHCWLQVLLVVIVRTDVFRPVF